MKKNECLIVPATVRDIPSGVEFDRKRRTKGYVVILPPPDFHRVWVPSRASAKHMVKGMGLTILESEV